MLEVQRFCSTGVERDAAQVSSEMDEYQSFSKLLSAELTQELVAQSTQLMQKSSATPDGFGNARRNPARATRATTTAGQVQVFENGHVKQVQVLPLKDLRKQEEQQARQQKMEERRRRNRERMARARHRYQSEVDSMKEHVAKLEAHLEKLQVAKAAELARGAEEPVQPEQVEKALKEMLAVQPKCSSYRELNREYTELLRTAGSLREERYWLRARMKQHQESQRLLQEGMTEMRAVAAPSIPEDMLTHDDQALDLMINAPGANEFEWLKRAVTTFHRSISPSEVFELVRTSYDEILHHANLADRLKPNLNTVLGWTDKRRIDEKLNVEFMLGKDFHLQSIEELLANTWDLLRTADNFRKLEPNIKNMRLLQQLNEDTLILAQDLVLPDEDVLFCTIFLLFRVRTPTGYIVGLRTLRSADPSLEESLGPKTAYTHIFLSFIFSHHQQQSLTGEVQPAPRGCHVRFGGQLGNGTAKYAEALAMNVLLGALRWETHCVGPLYRLENASS